MFAEGRGSALQREREFISILIKKIKRGPREPELLYVRRQVVRIKYSFVRGHANKTNPITKCSAGMREASHPNVTLIKNLIIL